MWAGRGAFQLLFPRGPVGSVVCAGSVPESAGSGRALVGAGSCGGRSARSGICTFFLLWKSDTCSSEMAHTGWRLGIVSPSSSKVAVGH